MAEAAKVRVGVRVRPLLPRELAQDVAQVISHPSEKQVLVDGNEAHRFTYDHVFPMHASQRDLYASTAAQMLQPFLDVSLTLEKQITFGIEEIVEGSANELDAPASPCYIKFNIFVFKCSLSKAGI